MTCTVLYNTDDSKALKAKGFSEIEVAKEWIDDNRGSGADTYIQNARVLIDYNAVEAYKEMYEDMKKEFFMSLKEFKKKMI